LFHTKQVTVSFGENANTHKVEMRLIDKDIEPEDIRNDVARQFEMRGADVIWSKLGLVSLDWRLCTVPQGITLGKSIAFYVVHAFSICIRRKNFELLQMSAGLDAMTGVYQ